MQINTQQDLIEFKELKQKLKSELAKYRCSLAATSINLEKLEEEIVKEMLGHFLKYQYL